MSKKGAFKEIGFLNNRSAHKKGKINEARTDEALDLLIEQGKIGTFWDGVDREGEDRIIQTNTGEEIPLQVKSSEYYAETFRLEHPDIPVLIVGENDDKERLAHKIEGLIRK